MTILFSVNNLPIQAQTTISLRPPFDGSYPIYSWVDHNSPNYQHNNNMVHYTGETNPDCDPSQTGYYSYCYDGHSGIDFGNMPEGTQILAAADGVVKTIVSSGVGYGNYIVLQHANSYETLYGHLSRIDVVAGQSILSGDPIGLSGNSGNSTGPHLHFGVYNGAFTASENNVTDPFGWTGSSQDPLINFNGQTAKCLWRSWPDDQVSCNDVLVEDGQNGSLIGKMSGPPIGWRKNTIGHSYQLNYHLNDSSDNYASWSNETAYGQCTIYAWIPYDLATANSVTYGIAGYQSGWRVQRIIDQAPFSDDWIWMWVDYFAKNDYPIVVIQNMTSGDPANTKWIGVDAVKFRCEHYDNSIYLPLIAGWTTGEINGDCNTPACPSYPVKKVFVPNTNREYPLPW